MPESRKTSRRRSVIGGTNPVAVALWSILAILVTLVFFFPLFWAISTSLRNPADTFTVTGLGIPFLLDNQRKHRLPAHLLNEFLGGMASARGSEKQYRSGKPGPNKKRTLDQLVPGR